jgi:hypothetical protein
VSPAVAVKPERAERVVVASVVDWLSVVAVVASSELQEMMLRLINEIKIIIVKCFIFILICVFKYSSQNHNWTFLLNQRVTEKTEGETFIAFRKIRNVGKKDPGLYIRRKSLVALRAG